MLTKHQILTKKITDNGLAEKIKPNSFIWNLIIDCMQTYKDQFDSEPMQTIIVQEPEETEKIPFPTETKAKCNHVWEHLGSGWYKCNKEFCEEVKEDKEKAKEQN